ncbi:MAG: VCBS repeat-containing protein, partial [candidate division Zixibacteria bacterium]|nr:VCBS repeat-containing protein [candidate division Zixibacteria bacterium]
MKTLGSVAMLVLTTLACCATVYAQTFTPVDPLFADVFRSSSDWGDYDGDGDLDFLLTGKINGGGGDVTILYRNDDSEFVDIDAGFIEVSEGGVDWGDYDNDGDLDFIITNIEIGEDRLTVVYRNDGNDIFTLVDISVLGVYQGAVDWADYDNDGDLDFAIMGYAGWPTRDIARVYRNDGGDLFTDIEAGLMGLSRGSIEWGDYDSDGDLDILTTGTAGFWDTRTVVFRNDGDDLFQHLWIGDFGTFDGQARWGDYDRDGDLDILVDGLDSTGGMIHAFVYRNDGSDVFTDIHANIPDAGESSSIAWGDCDNDGDLDVLVNASWIDGVHKYEGDSTFTPLDTTLNLGCCGSLAWGDFDRDGDLDFVVASLH